MERLTRPDSRPVDGGQGDRVECPAGWHPSRRRADWSTLARLAQQGQEHLAFRETGDRTEFGGFGDQGPHAFGGALG